MAEQKVEQKVVQSDNKPFVKNVIRMRQQKRKGNRSEKRDTEFDQRIVDIRRVAKVNSGSKRLRMSVLVVVGDKKGKVGVGLGRGSDVRSATDKAVLKAKKNMIFVPLKDQTIPHSINNKLGAAKIILKPAAPGTGVIAGSAIRAVVELAGIKDILTKVIGTNNKAANVHCTLDAFKKLKTAKL